MKKTVTQLDIAPAITTITPDMTTMRPSYDKKKIAKIVAIVVGAIVVILVAWLIIRHHKKTVVVPPAQMLQELESSSAPVTSTIQDRAAALVQVQKTSGHPVVTDQQTAATFSALSKK